MSTELAAEGRGTAEPRHPIGTVSERTGLTPEVLRVWERRYGAVSPARSEGGQRLYSDAEVEKLRLLRRVTHAGRAIGVVAGLSVAELTRMALEDDEARVRLEEREVRSRDRAISQAAEVAMTHTRRLDAQALEALLRRTAVLAGMSTFLAEVAAPFMHLVGEAWHDGRISPAHEHLATRVLQRVVEAAIDELDAADGAPAIVLGTPAGERHEMGALLAAAAAASEGWRIYYLGADLPAADIASTASAVDARAVAMSIVFAEDREAMAEELQELRRRLPASISLLVGGGASEEAAERLRDAGMLVMGDLDELRSTLRGWAAGALRN